MKLALVTGGTQRLGAAIAARLAEGGYDLALHYHTHEDLDADLSIVLEATGVRTRTFAADLREDSAPAKLMSSVVQAFGGPPTLLVNSASMFGGDRFESTDAQLLAEHFTVNAAAPALLAQAFAAARAGEEAGAAIVNLLDQRLDQPHAENFAYTLSKFALAGLTEMLARSLAPDIRVNAVAPGLTIPTESYSKAQLARVSQAMPLSRLPRPQEVADAVFWLAEAKAVTGETIHVDAGARHRSFDRDFDGL